MIAVPDAILYLVYTDMAQHDTIQHGPRLHTIIIRGVGWAFEQNGGGKNPLAAVSILSAGRIRRSCFRFAVKEGESSLVCQEHLS